MKKIKTGDGSYTYNNEEFDETYHSVSGAMEESLKKFVEPAGITKLARKGHIKILDFCFGFGYNSQVAIEVVLEVNPRCNVIIVGLEKDPELPNKVGGDNVSLKLLHGDAAEMIDLVDDYFDVCFFDPFSPKKHPALWTKEIFEKIYSKMKNGGVLTTYSCARVVRDNLKAAGFVVEDGPSVGRRAPSTTATKGF